jgi:outer membrane protein TolC
LAGGIGTDVDVAQARTQLETVRAQLLDVGVARAQYEHALGTIANYKLAEFSIPASPLAVSPGQSQQLTLPKVPVGLPSQLLERRPDIAAAERRRCKRTNWYCRQRLLSDDQSGRGGRL